jgi:hypothetical protein
VTGGTVTQEPEAAALPARESTALPAASGPGLVETALTLQRSVGNRGCRQALIPARPSCAGADPRRVPVRRSSDAYTTALSRAAAARRGAASPGANQRHVLGEAAIDVPLPAAGAASASRVLARDPADTPAAGSADVLPARPSSQAPVNLTESQAHELVDWAIAAFRGIPGAVTIPIQSPAVASVTPAPEQSVATWPNGRVLARSPDSSWHGEGGIVGSVQFCWDPCKAKLGVLGWVWAGIGVEYKLFGIKQFAGAYVFKELTYQIDAPSWLPTLDCGHCAAPEPDKRWESEGGAGFIWFPAVIKPDTAGDAIKALLSRLVPSQKEKIKLAGVELGLLWTPHSLYEHDVEFIVLIDLTGVIPALAPVKAAFEKFKDGSNVVLKKFGINLALDCGVGIDGSLTVHTCKAVPGTGIHGLTIDSIRGCFGAYLGCNIGLPEKKDLPGAKDAKDPPASAPAPAPPSATAPAPPASVAPPSGEPGFIGPPAP